MCARCFSPLVFARFCSFPPHFSPLRTPATHSSYQNCHPMRIFTPFPRLLSVYFGLFWVILGFFFSAGPGGAALSRRSRARMRPACLRRTRRTPFATCTGCGLGKIQGCSGPLFGRWTGKNSILKVFLVFLRVFWVGSVLFFE
jgi:hypothetical protein